MVILSEEFEVAPDPVADAAAALVEAAQASAEAYTPEDVHALVEAALQARALNEVGGLMSWLRRAYFGMDPKALEEVREEMARGIKTAHDRDRLVEHVGKLIGEAEAVRHGERAKSVDGKNPHGPMAVMRRWNQKTGSIGRYIGALEKVREELRRVKLAG